MESNSNQQLLKRIASLVSENKELKNKQRILTEANNRLTNELKECFDLIEKARHEYSVMSDNVYQQKRFETVTILYVEISAISSSAASSVNTSEYIDKVYHFMRLFRKIAKKFSLVKIHSIGAHFIYAGGIPEKNFINPVTVTLAAFEMLNTFETDTNNNDILNLSIGIHTGGVTALVDGKHTRLNYCESDADTVYETSRIVALCIDNKMTLSATTYELVKELFDCQYINALSMKDKKELELFNVLGIKKAYATDEKRYFPNLDFRTQLMLIQFRDLQEAILDKLEKELPVFLYYHNVKHTVDVVTQCELIGWAEGLNDHQLLMLKTAALFHDAGHTISYSNHEAHSIDVAREILPKYNYSPEEIEMIARLIMATKLPPKPTDLLESIICDSDLDYLGRIDFVPVSNTLYAELKVQNKELTLNDWNKMQLKFISLHQYFTKTGRKLRNVKKQEQIERIKQLIED